MAYRASGCSRCWHSRARGAMARGGKRRGEGGGPIWWLTHAGDSPWWPDLEPEGAAAALFVMGALGLTRMMQEGSGRPAVGDGARQEVTLGSGGGLGARPPAGAWAGAACRCRRRDALLRFYSWVAAALRDGSVRGWNREASGACTREGDLGAQPPDTGARDRGRRAEGLGAQLLGGGVQAQGRSWGGLAWRPSKRRR